MSQSSAIRPTAKQLMVLDYMRGNGGVLTAEGAKHLVSRGSFVSYRAISRVLDNLTDRGWIQHDHGPPWQRTDDRLTKEGLRVSEAAHA